MRKPIIFLATLPEPERYLKLKSFFSEDEFVLLHNGYTFSTKNEQDLFVETQKISEIVKKAGDRLIDEIGLVESLPPYEKMIQMDILLLRHSDLFVYDLDTNPGVQLIMAAYMNKLPAVAISSNLEHTIHPYFSSYFDEIIKPRSLPIWTEKFKTFLSTQTQEVSKGHEVLPPLIPANPPSEVESQVGDPENPS